LAFERFVSHSQEEDETENIKEEEQEYQHCSFWGSQIS